MVCQRELAPTTGQTHWQGYVRCATRKRMTTIKRLLNRENAHLEIAKGTEQQCKDYCTKIASRAVDDAEPFERGNFNPEEGSREGQGRRSDLEAAAAMIDSGASLLKWRKLTNLTLYVTTGAYAVQGAEGLGSAKAGKGRQSGNLVGSWRTWQDSLGQTSGWWSISVLSGSDTPPLGQLRGERTILLDEFKWESWPIDTMKRLMDKGRGAPCEVLQQIRRVASCHNLAEQFPGYFVQRCDRPDLAAFRRRVHRILYLDHRVESLEELEKLIDADNEYLFGINQFIL